MPQIKLTGQVIEIRCAFLQLRNDGIFQIAMKEHETIHLEDTKEIRWLKLELCGNVPAPNLFLMRKFSIPDHEARAYASTKESALYRSAEALVIYSLAQKLVANFYLRFNKPIVPTRFFQDEEEAIKWLLPFV
jgi:hypothetical protein